MNYLWRVKRPEVTKKVSEAAAQGDRSENAEYIYGKKQLRQIDSRVRFLVKRLQDMVVVREPPSDTSRVFFGAYVTLENEIGQVFEYRIVGPDEFDLKKGYISMDSPMARALMKKAIDDEVLIDLPNGKINYFVLGIKYLFE